MQRHKGVVTQSSPKALSHLKPTRHPRQRSFQLVIHLLALTTLACGTIGIGSRPDSDRVVVQNRLAALTRTPLPTLTPTFISNPATKAKAVEFADPIPPLDPTIIDIAATPAASSASSDPLPTFTSTPAVASEPGQASSSTDTSATSAPAIPAGTLTTPPADNPVSPVAEAPIPTITPVATATESPTPTPTPAPTATAEPKIETPGWAIAGVQLLTDQSGDRVVVYGDLINNTSSAQSLTSITGTFYDAQGQVIAGPDSTIDYWPIGIVPSGAQMPFELTVRDIQSAANFDLRVVAEPSSQTPRQDFEFSELDQWADGSGEYCVAGNIGNLGDAWQGAWQGYLVIVVTLYDSQDKVISFGEEGSIAGGDTLSFEICSQTFNQEVARYELGAWGR